MCHAPPLKLRLPEPAQSIGTREGALIAVCENVERRPFISIEVTAGVLIQAGTPPLYASSFASPFIVVIS